MTNMMILSMLTVPLQAPSSLQFLISQTQVSSPLMMQLLCSFTGCAHPSTSTNVDFLEET
eukprot:m.20084 g.20084  ORF g.20084 m.20084 type:complete len:60 (-) comp8109_c0_seq3:1324-1503(-)